MVNLSRFRQVAFRLALLAGAVTVGGCSLEGGEPPTLTGPSEFSLSVTLSATPDQLPRDGQSQSVITATVRNASGQPVSGQRLSLTTNMGSVSQSKIVTGQDGRASFAYTAPTSGVLGSTVVISVLPVGENADNSIPRTLTINLLGAANTTLPTAAFTVTPDDPEVSQVVRFDASTTVDEGAETPCLDACTY